MKKIKLSQKQRISKQRSDKKKALKKAAFRQSRSMRLAKNNTKNIKYGNIKNEKQSWKYNIKQFANKLLSRLKVKGIGHRK